MPELHKLTPYLGSLQDRGFKVALVTDGRMSGASGKVPAAIHLTPETLANGPIGKILDGDIIHLDASLGTLNLVSTTEDWLQRPLAARLLNDSEYGCGRELFAFMRNKVSDPESGASVF